MVLMSFQLPEVGEILIKKGQLVDFNTPLIRSAVKRNIEIPIAKELNINPANIFQSLKKLVGDTVKKGELLAETSGFLSVQRYTSDIDGKIIKIDYARGSVIIEPDNSLPAENEAVENAFFIGEVKDLIKRRITIEVKNYVDFLAKDVSHTFGGQLSRYNKPVSQMNLDDVQNRVMCVPMTSSFELTKLEVLEAAGLILPRNIGLQPQLPSAIMTNEADWEKLHRGSLPYIIVNQLEQKIYLYEC